MGIAFAELTPPFAPRCPRGPPRLSHAHSSNAIRHSGTLCTTAKGLRPQRWPNPCQQEPKAQSLVKQKNVLPWGSSARHLTQGSMGVPGASAGSSDFLQDVSLNRRFFSKSWCLHLCTADVMGRIIHYGGDRLVHHRIFSSILGFYPRDASSTLQPVSSIQNVPRHCQASRWRQPPPPVETTVLQAGPGLPVSSHSEGPYHRRSYKAGGGMCRHPLPGCNPGRGVEPGRPTSLPGAPESGVQMGVSSKARRWLKPQLCHLLP